MFEFLIFAAVAVVLLRQHVRLQGLEDQLPLLEAKAPGAGEIERLSARVSALEKRNHVAVPTAPAIVPVQSVPTVVATATAPATPAPIAVPPPLPVSHPVRFAPKVSFPTPTVQRVPTTRPETPPAIVVPPTLPTTAPPVSVRNRFGSEEWETLVGGSIINKIGPSSSSSE